MSEIRFTITPPLQTVIKALDDEQLYAGPLRTFLNRMVFTGQAKAREKAKPHGGDTGALANSIQTRLDGGSIPLWAEVYTSLLYAEPAEFGRGPGKMPPVEAIAAWARRHGASDPSAAFLIARAIGRRGTKGLRFMQQAEEEMNRKMPDFIEQMSADIASNWSKAA